MGGAQSRIIRRGWAQLQPHPPYMEQCCEVIRINTHHCAAASLVSLPWLPESTLVTTDTRGWPLHVAVSEGMKLWGCEGVRVRLWSYGGVGRRSCEDEEWKRNSIQPYSQITCDPTEGKHGTLYIPKQVWKTQLDVQTFRSIQLLPWQLSQSASYSVGTTSSCSLLVFPLSVSLVFMPMLPLLLGFLELITVLKY